MANWVVRRIRVRTIKASLVLGTVLLCSPLVAASLSMPPSSRAVPSFFFGERLAYDISWGGIIVGQGVLQTQTGEPWNGRNVFHITSTAASNRVLSIIFPVKDRIESIVDATGLYPYKIIVDQKHGSRQRNKEIRFDQDGHTALLLSKGKESLFDVPPQVQDILSSLYYFRTFPQLESGSSVFIDVHESKKNWKLEIKILGREMLNTVLGTIPTVKVKAIILFEGVLWQKGDLYIWLTDDTRHIPVMMNGKVMIGSVTATLTQVEPQQLIPAP
jgi:hypothetical protein